MNFSGIHDNSGSGNTIGGVVLQGSVNRATTWGATPSFPFMVDSNFPNLSFNAALRLNGTVIKFLPGSSVLTLNDSLVANNAVFTSLADDQAGGDSNGDGPATLPAPGGWRLFDARGNTQIRRSRVSYGGSGANSELQLGLFQTATVESSLIHQSASNGVVAGGQLVTLSGCALIENSSFAAFRSSG